MTFHLVTLFPEFFEALNISLMGKAQQKGLVDFNLINLRTFGLGKHETVDDRPFGGGPGMVISAPVMAAAVRSVPASLKVFLSPRGIPFTQKIAEKFLNFPSILLACGRFEGLDQRVIEKDFDLELSIGPFILNGGEAAALCVVEAVSRLIPGFMSNQESVLEESHGSYETEFPQYTRPQVWEELAVPEFLLNGDHKKTEQQRREQGKGYRPVNKMGFVS